MNYMNVLSDFERRLDSACPGQEIEHEITTLRRRIEKRDEAIARLETEIHNLRSKLKKMTVKASNGTVKTKGSTTAARKGSQKTK
ncbi:MAG: hypothetical protein R2744_10890 [Bacteroidales bacterium]